MNFRITARLIFVLYILFCTMVMAQDVKKKDGKPVLTAEQKLEIRTAQVKMFQAKTVLESTPQYKAFLSAQEEMNEIALRVQRASGADPSKWQLTQDLEYVAVPASPQLTAIPAEKK